MPPNIRLARAMRPAHGDHRRPHGKPRQHRPHGPRPVAVDCRQRFLSRTNSGFRPRIGCIASPDPHAPRRSLGECCWHQEDGPRHMPRRGRFARFAHAHQRLRTCADSMSHGCASPGSGQPMAGADHALHRHGGPDALAPPLPLSAGVACSGHEVRAGDAGGVGHAASTYMQLAHLRRSVDTVRPAQAMRPAGDPVGAGLADSARAPMRNSRRCGQRPMWATRTAQ